MKNEKPAGTSACPICDLDRPHRHTKYEIARWRADEARRAIPDMRDGPLGFTGDAGAAF